MSVSVGDRVKYKRNHDIVGVVIDTDFAWLGSGTLVTVKLDEPMPCGCGKSHASKFSASPEDWIPVIVQ